MTLLAFFGGVDPWIFTFSFVTVAVTIGMGFWSARKSKTASDFFVAGRSVSDVDVVEDAEHQRALRIHLDLQRRDLGLAAGRGVSAEGERL